MIHMFTPKQYRAKAVEFGNSAKTSADPNEKHRLQELQHHFTELADNEQWLADNHQRSLTKPEKDQSDGPALADEEERILRCLGAAVIMQWNTFPAKLQRELFDNASTMGELVDTAALRGQIARFLHKHRNDENTVRT